MYKCNKFQQKAMPKLSTLTSKATHANTLVDMDVNETQTKFKIDIQRFFSNEAMTLLPIPETRRRPAIGPRIIIRTDDVLQLNNEQNASIAVSEKKCVESFVR